MTTKQQAILNAALKLFATKGFASTSTRKVAREAGVSEGLIFRHFNNKEGLLAAIMQQAHEESSKLMEEIASEKTPKKVIQKTLELPFTIHKDQYEMWRLTYALKWQTDRYDTSSLDVVKKKIQSAFKAIGYQHPAAETEILFMMIDGVATSFLLHEPKQKNTILKALKAKYNL